MDRQTWLKNRQKGIGSSDAGPILGVSPYRTILDVYHDKTADVIVEDTTNQGAKDLGNAIEPRVRALFEKLQGRTFAPVNLIHVTEHHLMASLDGLAANGDTLEIKLHSIWDHKMAIAYNRPPKKYIAQLQHILLVSGAPRIYYVAYPWTPAPEVELDRAKLVVIEVLPDLEYRAKMLLAENQFWFESVLKRIPPKTVERLFPVWGENKNARGNCARGETKGSTDVHETGNE